MAALLPATVCMTTAVELLISAVATVLSTLSTSTPVSSTNAPRVPEPSSREMTAMASLPPLPPQAAKPSAMAPMMLMARIALKIFFITQNSFLIVSFDFGSRAYHTGSL